MATPSIDLVNETARMLVNQLEAGAVLAPAMRDRLKKILDQEPVTTENVSATKTIVDATIHAKLARLATTYISSTVGRPGNNKAQFYEDLDTVDSDALADAYLQLFWNYLQEARSLRDVRRMSDYLTDARPRKISGYQSLRNIARGEDSSAQNAKKILRRLRDLLLASPTKPTEDSWNDQRALFAVAYGLRGMREVQINEWDWARSELQKVTY